MHFYNNNFSLQMLCTNFLRRLVQPNKIHRTNPVENIFSINHTNRGIEKSLLPVILGARPVLCSALISVRNATESKRGKI